MYIGGNQSELYFNWVNEHMANIDGVTCSIDGDSPNRQGRCYFNEDYQTCEYLWSQMKDFDIQIDTKGYRVPPKSQTVRTSNKKCQPGIFFRETQPISTLG